MTARKWGRIARSLMQANAKLRASQVISLTSQNLMTPNPNLQQISLLPLRQNALPHPHLPLKRLLAQRKLELKFEFRQDWSQIFYPRLRPYATTSAARDMSAAETALRKISNPRRAACTLRTRDLAPSWAEGKRTSDASCPLI